MNSTSISIISGIVIGIIVGLIMNNMAIVCIGFFIGAMIAWSISLKPKDSNTNE